MSRSLRRRVQEISGEDLSRCQACMDCDEVRTPEMDVSLGSLIQMVLLDDEEVFAMRTVWSDEVLYRAKGVCKRGLDLPAILLALRRLAKFVQSRDVE